MSTQLFLNMQASIERSEARNYGHRTVAELEGKAANIRGIGFPFSADALRLVRDESRTAQQTSSSQLLH